MKYELSFRQEKMYDNELILVVFPYCSELVIWLFFEILARLSVCALV